ncbi:MAG TPA: hypothetical protein PK002_09100 [Cellvibrio sp.]|nr:hypothetical protein [Cellvibrio sp.]
MYKKVIFLSALITTLALSAHAQQCTDEQMKKVMSEIPNTNTEDALNQKKFDEKVDTLTKLKHWNNSQKTDYAMKVMLSKENYAPGKDPLTVSTKMMNAFAKKDCKTIAEMNKISAEYGKQMWAGVFKKLDEDIAKAK